MQLFYTPDITPPLYELPEEESRHCLRVLRMSAGDELHLTDGRGNLYRARLEEPSGGRCLVRIVETVHEFEKRPYTLTVAAAPTKNIERFEWFLEKAVETGIDAIIPIDCDHSERHTIKPERQEKIIVSALKQSLKAYLPHLAPMMPVRELLSGGLVALTGGCNFQSKGDVRVEKDETPDMEQTESHNANQGVGSAAKRPEVKLIAHCREEFPREFIGDILPRGANAIVLIGPEGDFSREEVELALANGFRSVSLGGARLRTETAALGAVTIAAFING